MSFLLYKCIFFMTIAICYATNCYELQQSHISSLNDRMAHMLNSFYTPMPNSPPMPVPIPVATDYPNPFDVNPYQYAQPSIQYGSPAFYSPQMFPKPAMKPYYNAQPKEYPSMNWGNFYDYPMYPDFERPQFSPPMTYPTPPPPYSPAPYTPPCTPSPPIPSYPSWEYPVTPEYSYSYPTYPPPPSQFTQYTLPSPPQPSYPSPLYHRYAEIAPPTPYIY